METEFDFQEWALLAKESPEAFERRRREAIQHFLDASDEEQRRLAVFGERRFVIGHA